MTQINEKTISSPATVINEDLSETSSLGLPADTVAPITVINDSIDGEPECEELLSSVPSINDTISEFYAPTTDGGSRQDGNLLQNGETICGKYIVQDRLEVTSGEADLYICTFEGKQYVAKLYRRKVAVKEDVAQALLNLDSPYVAKLYESSTHNGYPVEISAYYRNGSLQGKTFSYDDLRGMLIPGINEGLRALHQAKIIHKDLKPSNIMFTDKSDGIVLIDFGISSVMSEGSSVVVTRTGMTPEYSAPETFKGLFLEESDYYSFGVTLFELFSGYTPYANMSMEEIEQYVSLQRIPFPETMPALLKDFISALTYYDISNRQNKNNPNRRWTYHEVNSWLNGESLVTPGEGIGNVGKGMMPVYGFAGQSYTDPAALVGGMAICWEEGKRHLFRSLLTQHFRPFDQKIAQYCQAAEDEARQTNGKDDIIFFKLLYQIHPRLKGFYWKGQRFESLPALGRDVLEHLWNNDVRQNPYYESVLAEKLLSKYVELAAPNNESLRRAAVGIEDMYVYEVNHGTDRQRTLYFMAYALSGQKLLSLGGQKFRTVGELAAYMRSELKESFESFEALCHRLVDYYGNLDVQLETWLVTIGKQKELEAWKQQMLD